MSGIVGRASLSYIISTIQPLNLLSSYICANYTHEAGLAVVWWKQCFTTGPSSSGEMVRSKLLASYRTNVFSPDVTATDRGAGLAQAPDVRS